MLYTQLAEFAKEYHYDIPNDYRMYQEIETIEDILSYLNIEDIEVQWDDEFEQIIAADEDNTWNGKEFYDFLLNEAIVYDDKDAPNGIPTSVYERLKDFASIQKIPEIKESPKIDYHIADEHLGAGTPKERYRNNIAAIKLLFLWKNNIIVLQKKNKKSWQNMLAGVDLPMSLMNPNPTGQMNIMN